MESARWKSESDWQKQENGWCKMKIRPEHNAIRLAQIAKRLVRIRKWPAENGKRLVRNRKWVIEKRVRPVRKEKWLGRNWIGPVENRKRPNKNLIVLRGRPSKFEVSLFQFDYFSKRRNVWSRMSNAVDRKLRGHLFQFWMVLAAKDW